MALTDYSSLIPDDKREAYNAEISKAVVIASKEDAQKFIESNDLVKGLNQADRDRRYNEMLEKFNKEKLPQIIEEEKKKGQKQPWEIKQEELEKRILDGENKLALERQKTKALAKAQELGIPSALVDKFIGLTDEETDAGLKFLADTVIPYRDGHVKSALEKIGKQPAPQGGASQDPKDIRTQYDEAVKAGNGELALALQSKLQGQALHRG